MYTAGLSVEISPNVTEKSPRLNILVVDDEPLIRWSVTEALAHEGHTMSEAGNARDTLQRLSEVPTPDVIVLDYRLPDSNDLKLLETIRQRLPSTAVIMMTAFGSPDFVAGATSLGVYRVMNKPFELRELVSLIPAAYSSNHM